MPTPTQETLHALLALQQIDRQIQRTRKTLTGLDTGAQAAADAQTALTTARQKRDAAHKSAADLKDSELKLSALETKQKQYQQRLYQGSITNAKELANIEKEIGALGRQRSDLDGRILELMDETERLAADAALAEADAHGAEVRRTDATTAFRTRHEALELELAEATRRRTEAAAVVPDKALLKRYDDLRVKGGGVGIALIEGNTCGGCHMTLPSGLVKAVKEGASPQVCDNCGRLLTS